MEIKLELTEDELKVILAEKYQRICSSFDVKLTTIKLTYSTIYLVFQAPEEEEEEEAADGSTE